MAALATAGHLSDCTAAAALSRYMLCTSHHFTAAGYVRQAGAIVYQIPACFGHGGSPTTVAQL